MSFDINSLYDRLDLDVISHYKTRRNIYTKRYTELEEKENIDILHKFYGIALSSIGSDEVDDDYYSMLKLKEDDILFPPNFSNVYNVLIFLFIIKYKINLEETIRTLISDTFHGDYSVGNVLDSMKEIIRIRESLSDERINSSINYTLKLVSDTYILSEFKYGVERFRNTSPLSYYTDYWNNYKFTNKECKNSYLRNFYENYPRKSIKFNEDIFTIKDKDGNMPYTKYLAESYKNYLLVNIKEAKERCEDRYNKDGKMDTDYAEYQICRLFNIQTNGLWWLFNPFKINFFKEYLSVCHDLGYKIKPLTLLSIKIDTYFTNEVYYEHYDEYKNLLKCNYDHINELFGVPFIFTFEFLAAFINGTRIKDKEKLKSEIKKIFLKLDHYLNFGSNRFITGFLATDYDKVVNVLKLKDIRNPIIRSLNSFWELYYIFSKDPEYRIIVDSFMEVFADALNKIPLSKGRVIIQCIKKCKNEEVVNCMHNRKFKQRLWNRGEQEFYRQLITDYKTLFKKGIIKELYNSIII